MEIQLSTVAHTSYHFEDLPLSSQEFYKSIEAQLKYYEYPEP